MTTMQNVNLTAVDCRATLKRWRTESIRAPSDRFTTRQTPEAVVRDTGRWPDERSRRVEEELLGRGIEVPWDPGHRFGERDFRLSGLRAGAIGVVLVVESLRRDPRRLYAAKTLGVFFRSEYLNLPPREQEEISRGFLEEALPWLEMDRHPHILSVQRLETVIHPSLERSIPFIYMEFAPAGSLRDLLVERGRLTLQEILVLGIQVCGALRHAYKHGLEVHRDIKPDNLMVWSDGRFRLTDFSTGVVGTPGYMAPEQVTWLWRTWGDAGVTGERPVDRQADQFAVGLVMLESLLGLHPYPICLDACRDRDRALEFARDGVGEIPREEVPDALRAVFARVLSPRPEERYPDVSVLRGELLEIHEQMTGRYTEPVIEEDDSADRWFHRARAYKTLERPTQAVPSFEKALERYRRLPGSAREMAECLKDLGSAYRLIGRFSRAEKACKEAVGICRSLPDAELQVAESITLLGNVYNNNGRFPEAEEAYRDALSIYRRHPGQERREADCRLNLATIHHACDRYDRAVALLSEALEVYRRIPGAEVDRAICLLNMGSALNSAGRLSDTQAAVEEALGIFQSVPGTEYYRAICLLNLARVDSRRGRVWEAEKKLKEALELQARVPGLALEREKCSLMLGKIYRDTGRFGEAETTFREALALLGRRPELGDRRAVVEMHLGILYRNMGRFDEAEKVLKKAIRTFRRTEGQEHLHARCTLELARCSASKGEPSQARRRAREALNRCEALPPETAERIRTECREVLEELPC